MSELNHCLEMAAICRQRALEDTEKKNEWLAKAEMWHRLAGEAIGHSFKK
jgi:hypothetical protein